MKLFHAAFADELVKMAGLVGSVGKTLAKNPLSALAVIPGLYTVGKGALEAYQGGLQGGAQPRYLNASAAGPSDAFYTNYHDLFEHKNTPAEERALSWNFNEKSLRG